MGKITFSDLEDILKKRIDKKRFRHTKGVEMTAACMAMKFGYKNGLRDEEQAEFIRRARLAGLLHDNAKNLTDKQFIDECNAHHIEITDTERRHPYLLHGKLGACYLKPVYGIEDDEIASAIACHTTGKPAMSLLEKILFIADYIEPGRKKQPNLELVRYLAMTDLDTCVYKISEDTLEYLSKTPGEIDEMTVNTRDYYQKLSHLEDYL